jgi:hypothetical protein
MAYEEEHKRRSRVVVETPAAHREVVETRTERVPERQGFSSGAVAAIVVAAVALTAIVVLMLMNNQQAEDDTSVRVATSSAPTPMPQTTIVQQPVQQPQPVIIQQPATPQTPIIVPAPTTSSTTTDSATRSANDDLTIQTNIEKKLADDPTLSKLGITVTVIDGKVTLMGMVDTVEMKRRVERFVRIKGVKSIDNQITVTGSADTTAPQ